MLDHTKSYIAKMHNIDAELAVHVHKLDVTLQSFVGVVFLCLLYAFLPSFTILEWIDQQHFAKTKTGYISLPSNLNAIIGITSYFCVILEMMVRE